MGAGGGIGVACVYRRSGLVAPCPTCVRAPPVSPAGGAPTIWVAVPKQRPDPAEVMPCEAAVPEVIALEKAARALGIPVKLAQGSGPPPCAFPERGRPTHLFSLTAGGRKRTEYTEIPACA